MGGAVSVEARRAVAKLLNIGDPGPILEAYQRWPMSKRARSPDAHFRSAAKRIFANLTPDERKACQPLAEMEAEIAVKSVRASPQLLARLGGSRHAH